MDRAFAAKADYIVSNDSDFNILKQTAFPSISVVSADAFKTILVDKRLSNDIINLLWSITVF